MSQQTKSTERLNLTLLDDDIAKLNSLRAEFQKLAPNKSHSYIDVIRKLMVIGEAYLAKL